MFIVKSLFWLTGRNCYAHHEPNCYFKCIMFHTTNASVERTSTNFAWDFQIFMAGSQDFLKKILMQALIVMSMSTFKGQGTHLCNYR